MKAPIVLLCLTLTGCSLLPKQVEFFQREVKAVPDITAKAKETQRQAADYVAFKTAETKEAALTTDAAPEVVQPATDANTVAEALAVSLGPPATPWKAEAEALKLKLQRQEADFNAKLESYRKLVQRDVGKDIEGTGAIQMGYFSYLALVAGLIALLWAAFRVWGLFNPVVGAAGRISSGVLHRGFAEIVEGGKKFTRWVSEETTLTDDQKAKIVELFVSAQKEEQSGDVRSITKTLVKHD